MQISDTLQGSVTERIIKESITLFYIELILFEEAAIYIADDRIVNFLTQLDQYSPNQVLKNINLFLLLSDFKGSTYVVNGLFRGRVIHLYIPKVRYYQS